MNVRKQEAANYLVESERLPGQWHKVDLLAFETFGECSCEHFTIRLLPLLRSDRRPINGPCKHINAARHAFTEDVLRRMLELERTNPPR